jgi:hypothetical protein
MAKLLTPEALEEFRKMDEACEAAEKRTRQAREAYLAERSEATKEEWAAALKEELRLEAERWKLHKEYMIPLNPAQRPRE